MSLIFLPICYFLQNGVTVDDLGLLLAGGAVIILMIGVTCHAMRVLSAHFIAPAADLYLNVLFGEVLDQAVEPTETEGPTNRASDDPVTIPDEDDFP